MGDIKKGTSTGKGIKNVDAKTTTSGKKFQKNSGRVVRNSIKNANLGLLGALNISEGNRKGDAKSSAGRPIDGDKLARRAASVRASTAIRRRLNAHGFRTSFPEGRPTEDIVFYFHENSSNNIEVLAGALAALAPGVDSAGRRAEFFLENVEVESLFAAIKAAGVPKGLDKALYDVATGNASADVLAKHGETIGKLLAQLENATGEVSIVWKSLVIHRDANGAIDIVTSRKLAKKIRTAQEMQLAEKLASQLARVPVTVTSAELLPPPRALPAPVASGHS